MANPDYMADLASSSTLAFDDSTRVFPARGQAEASECIASMFPQLPTTHREGLFASQLMSKLGGMEVTYCEHAEAREALLKGIRYAPRVLHIATHGYFCQQSDANPMANPLLRSGLILAGANRTIAHLDKPTSSSEDGILTALEASGLPAATHGGIALR